MLNAFVAIYENGVFRPRTPVDLPEGAQVRFHIEQERPEPVSDQATSNGDDRDDGDQELSVHQQKIHEILSERYDGGESDVAADHNEYPRTKLGTPSPEAIQAVYEVLSHRYRSGEHDVAERHNEHQP